MRGPLARSVILSGILLAGTALPGWLSAQEPGAPAARPRPPEPPPRYERLISLNPAGLLVDYYSGELERPISDAGTLAVSGTLDPDGDLVGDGESEFLNVDVVLRFYPSGRPMHGWAFGMKAGITRIEGGTASGFGFDVGRSWLLGANENFYVGAGFGLKRLLGGGIERDFLPTFRLVDVGFAF